MTFAQLYAIVIMLAVLFRSFGITFEGAPIFLDPFIATGIAMLLWRKS